LREEVAKVREELREARESRKNQGSSTIMYSIIVLIKNVYLYSLLVPKEGKVQEGGTPVPTVMVGDYSWHDVLVVYPSPEH
jgi:hypothetical protein